MQPPRGRPPRGPPSPRSRPPPGTARARRARHRVLEMDHEAVGHPGHALRPRVDLGCPHADPAPVQVPSERPVMTTVPRSVRVARSPWAHMPGKPLEVGGAVTGRRRRHPEPDRHGRHGAVSTSSPSRPTTAPALVDHLHPRAQAAAGDLAGPDGVQRAASDEAGADVGAATERRQQQVGLHVLVHPARGQGGQRRPGGPQGPQARQGVQRRGAIPALGTRPGSAPGPGAGGARERPDPRGIDPG